MSKVSSTSALRRFAERAGRSLLPLSRASVGRLPLHPKLGRLSQEVMRRVSEKRESVLLAVLKMPSQKRSNHTPCQLGFPLLCVLVAASWTPTASFLSSTVPGQSGLAPARQHSAVSASSASWIPSVLRHEVGAHPACPCGALASQAPARRLGILSLKSSAPAEEKAVLDAIASGERSDEQNRRVRGLIEELCAADVSLPRTRSGLTGAWRPIHDDLGKPTSFDSEKEKKLQQAKQKQLSSSTLQMFSFGVLPPVEIKPTATYNEVGEDTYKLWTMFSVEGSLLDAEAALCLAGTLTPDAETADRFTLQFFTAELFPSATNTAASTQMLADADLLGFLRSPLQLKGPAAWVDVQYLSAGLRVQKGQSGAAYVFSRMLSTQDIIPPT